MKEFVFAQAAIAGGSLQRNELIEEIVGEAAIMSFLQHPRILHLYGCSLTSQVFVSQHERRLQTILYYALAQGRVVLFGFDFCVRVHVRVHPVVHLLVRLPQAARREP